GANRPGGLPCPDTDNNGEEELNCGEIGRLPWRTLDVPELRDSAGAKLWYAVSPNYLNRAASEPLNSDVPGQLSLDGADGIVALVFAPGAPLGAQTLRAANPNDVVQFLDGVNAVADGDYTAALSATQNDLVLPITVAEIMRDVHKRVTAAAADLVSRHLATYGFSNYLWLAPFDNPATSNLMARTTVLQGHIPLHVAGQNYTSDYTVEWSITGPGVQLNAGPNTLTQAALQENTQTVAAGICRNAGGPLDQFSCDPANAVQTNGLPAGVDTRTFEFNLPSFFSDSGYDIRPPAASRVGSRNVSVENAVFAASPAWVIRITDRDAGANVLGGGTITFDNVTNGDLAVNGIHLAPQIDPGGDYAWYLNNNWHALVYMSVAPGYAPGQANTCAIGCLTLLNGPPPIGNKPAVLLVAGAPLAGPRPSADLRDYFEGENANEDTVFAVNFVSPVFNDSVRTLAGP
ncbi:MAG: hypothetical protein OEQ18_15915, partial [Gammaproteobacteria bacterium]|nr:hypothetical protein [Gammaproteobacteria bacterium]